MSGVFTVQNLELFHHYLEFVAWTASYMLKNALIFKNILVVLGRFNTENVCNQSLI